MNGVRSTFMRRGYLLTALSALLLLAASSGTALAQQLSDVTVTLSAPERVVEGGDITVTVRGKATVLPTPEAGDTASDRVVTVNLEVVSGTGIPTFSTAGEFDAAGQVDDAGIVSNPRVTLVFAENTGTESRDRTVTGSITVRTNDDADAEHEAVQVQLDSDGGGLAEGNAGGTTESPAPVGFTILDDETQTYVLTLDPVTHTSLNPPKEGEDIVVNLEAKPEHVQGGNTLTLQMAVNGGRATGYRAGAGRVAIGTNNPDGTDALEAPVNKRPITITTPTNDENRATDILSLEAHSGPAGRDSLADSIAVDVLDVHMLPGSAAITAVAKDKDGNVVTEIMEGGDPVFLTLTVDRGRGSADRITDEELTVDIKASDAGQVADYALSDSRIDLESRSSGKQSNDVDVEIELSARSDEDVGMEYLMLDLEVSGDKDFGTETSTGTFSIGIVDNTVKKIEPKATEADYDAIKAAIAAGAGDEGLNPGETVTLMTSDLFTVAKGYTASYGVSVDGDAVSVSASSEMITINAVKAGESVLVVTGTARMASSSLEPSQTVSDVASLKFPVMVVDKALDALVVTLHAPDSVMDGNIVEGMSYDIMVTANRAVTDDEGEVEVMIMRDRAKSDADDDDFEVTSATIAAGEDSAAATLTVVEDNEPDAGHAMGEVLVLYGESDGAEVEGELTFTIWDEAVPALPLIAQLLLALFLMAGGSRLYRRRQG